MTRKKKFVKFLGVNSLKCTVFHFGSGLLPVYKLKGPCTQNREVQSLSLKDDFGGKKKKKKQALHSLGREFIHVPTRRVDVV